VAVKPRAAGHQIQKSRLELQVSWWMICSVWAMSPRTIRMPRISSRMASRRRARSPPTVGDTQPAQVAFGLKRWRTAGTVEHVGRNAEPKTIEFPAIPYFSGWNFGAAIPWMPDDDVSPLVVQHRSYAGACSATRRRQLATSRRSSWSGVPTDPRLPSARSAQGCAG
jgi:hypothetical protein